MKKTGSSMYCRMKAIAESKAVTVILWDRGWAERFDTFVIKKHLDNKIHLKNGCLSGVYIIEGAPVAPQSGLI